MSSPARKAVIVGISGCSSSGKTTLARLLRDLFTGSFILHEDDFYKPDEEIPIGVDGLADWDCPEALAVPDMTEALAYIRANGAPPVSHPSAGLSHRTNHGRRRRGTGCRVVAPAVAAAPVAAPSAAAAFTASTATTASTSSTFAPPSLPLTPPQANLVSKEDKNDVGACPVSDAALAAARARVQAWLQPGQPGHYLIDGNNALRICFLDGFLLYCPQLRPVMDLIDVRLFLRVSRARATQRRAARSGYVTLDGFWQDPPGYMEKIVWPNYVAAHRWLFGGKEDADVEGPPDAAILAANQILTQTDRGPDVDMETTLAWTIDTLLAKLGQTKE